MEGRATKLRRPQQTRVSLHLHYVSCAAGPCILTLRCVCASRLAGARTQFVLLVRICVLGAHRLRDVRSRSARTQPHRDRSVK